MKSPRIQKAYTRFFNDIYKASVDRANLEFFFDNLNHGTKVLNNQIECEQYIALYGGHHFYKLYAAFASTNFQYIQGKNIEIIDWGCGQALATCVLIDYLIENCISPKVVSITLIDPSLIALQKGCELIRLMLPSNSCSTDFMIRNVNKYMNDLIPNDLVSKPENIKIHLFSNIIDVEGFDLNKLYELIITCFGGINRIICTSPDNARQHRLDKFHNLFSQSWSVKRYYSSSDAVEGEIFYVRTGRYEKRKIKRYEKQFTVKLPQS